MMKKLHRIIKRENGRLYICGMSVPCYSELSGYRKRLRIGPFSVMYEVNMELDRICVFVLGFRLPVMKANLPRKYRHYVLRDELTTERRKRILKRLGKTRMGYVPDIDHPKTFNEKILWLKLYHEDPRITVCCDKYAAKDYAADVIGREYVVPLLGVYSKGTEIDFDALPDQFVLKVNWSSGYNIIVKDKSQIDREEIVRQIDEWMKPEMNSYYHSFNWGYKDMKPMAIAEEYLKTRHGAPNEYKLHMSHGQLCYFVAVRGQKEEGKRNFTRYDREKNFLHLPDDDQSAQGEAVPVSGSFENMLALSRKLSEPFPYVRVDWYEMDDNEIRLGEMTFYSAGGMTRMEGGGDQILGDLLPWSPPEPRKNADCGEADS